MSIATEKVDPGIRLLADRMASLTGRADWPATRFGSPSIEEAIEWLKDLHGDLFEAVAQWCGEALAGPTVNPDIWDECPVELIVWLGSLDGKIEIKTEDVPAASADASSPEEVDEDVADILKALSAVGKRWRPDIEMTVEKFLDDLSEDESDDLDEWLCSVLDTLVQGGDVRANGGDLLIVPICLTPLVEDVPAADGEPAADDASAAATTDLADDPVPSQPPRAETPEEARRRLEDMLPIALRQLRDAESLAESRKKAHDAAKKNVDAMQDQLNALVEELGEALTGMAGGDFQTRLPFDRVSQPATGQPDPAAEKSDEPENAAAAESDPIIGSAIHLLTRDQLSAKTNGRSGDAGISDAIADKLGDAGIYTIGQLEALMREKGGSHWYRDLTGIGKGKAEDICNALEALRRVFPMAGDE